MQAVVGLFERDENIQSAIYELKKAGFAEDTIKILTDYDTIQKLFGRYESHQVIGYMIGGALVGVTILLLYGLIVGGYACTSLLGYIPLSFLTCSVVGSIAIGLILGAAAGWFIGVNKFEKSADQYTHGVCQGHKLMTVRATGESTPKALKILQQEQAEAIKTFDDLQEDLKETIWQHEW